MNGVFELKEIHIQLYEVTRGRPWKSLSKNTAGHQEGGAQGTD